ncbi:MAG: hypothetical protein U0X91_20455 [Spirosomataceae bacterium]
MKWTLQNSKIIAAGLAFLLTAGVIGGLYYWDKSDKLAGKNDRLSLTADSLLSAKLTLERDINDLNLELGTLQKDNLATVQKLGNTQKLLHRKNEAFAKLRQESTSQQEDIQALQGQMAELTALKNELQAEVEKYRQEKTEWASHQDQFRKENEALQTQINTLTEQMSHKVDKNQVVADHFRVDVLKNNNKVTAKAKKARTVLVSFMPPSTWLNQGKQDVFLSMTDQKGQPLPGVVRRITVTADDTTDEVPVHALQTVDFGPNLQKIVFEFDPAESVPEGVYKARIYTTHAYLGAVEFHLRDSFWFF